MSPKSSLATVVSVGLLVGLASCGGSSSGGALPTPPPTGFQATPGFVALKDKILAGESIEVAFLGGSITVGATTQPLVDPDDDYDYSGYDRETDSWRARVFEGLRQDYEQVAGQFVQINASLSGTGSDLGAFRYAQDVGQHDPDILFVEFAVNDSGRSSQNPQENSSIERALKSIVQQARATTPDVAIFIAISTVRRYYDSASPAFVESRRITMDTAIGLDVPYADMTTAFFDSPLPPNFNVNQLYSGPTTPGNSLHPAPAGHELYARHVLQVIEEIFDDDGFVYAEPLVPLPDDLEPWPITPAIAGPLDLDQVGTSVQLNQEDWFKHPLFEGLDALFVDQTNVTLTHVFTGSSCAIWWEWQYAAGELAAAVEIRLDGIDYGRFSSPVIDETIDQRLPRWMTLSVDLDPAMPHTLEIIVPNDQPVPVQDMRLALFGVCADGG